MKVYFNGEELADLGTVSESVVNEQFVQDVKNIVASTKPLISTATYKLENGNLYFTVTPQDKGR